MARGATKQPLRPGRPQVTSKEQWGRLAVHTVTLPSTAVVKIKIPDLSLLVAGGAVPDRLRAVALRQVTEQLHGAKQEAARAPEELAEPDLDAQEEEISGLAALSRWIVATMVVEPEVSEEDIEAGAIPNEDVQMLLEFAQRARVRDARGVRLGVTPIDVFEVWRQAHGCEDDCAECELAIDMTSTRG